jgi:hypothetical protein
MISNRLVVALMAVLGSTFVPLPSTAHEVDEGPTSAKHRERIVFTVDVAEDLSKFVSTPVSPSDPFPKRGATFVTEGRIFPGGTIPADGSSFDPSRDGSIGAWTCRGIHLVGADELPGAPIWVHSAQFFALPDDRRAISTEGLEGSAPIRRPVTGATGSLKGYLGEQRQEFLGFNATGGVNLRVTFVLHKATR